MASEGRDGVSLILEAVRDEEAGAEDRLFELVYEELRRMAGRRMGAEPRSQTLQTTALVHEVYLRLFRTRHLDWENRRHFFGAAARAMRQILIERARARRRKKRDWGGRRITLDDNIPDAEPPVDLIALDEALTRLSRDFPRQAEVVKFRYFLGLTVIETAELLRVAPRTVDSDWQLARAWLRRELAQR